MSKTRFLVGPLVALIFIGLLIVGGFAVHRLGWSDGYRMGQLAAGGEGGAVTPYAPYGFGASGLLLSIGVIFLLLIVIGKFFRFWAWKMAGGAWMAPSGPKGKYWAKHWHRAHRRAAHGPVPPWCWEWEEPSEEEAAKAEPDAEAGDAEEKI